MIGNDMSTARCIRPGGRRCLLPWWSEQSVGQASMGAWR